MKKTPDEMYKIYFTGLEKIRAQIGILNNYNFLPENFSIESLLTFINKFNTTKTINQRSFHLGFLIGGPMIVSHLTLGGRIKGVSILPPFLYSRRIFNITGLFNRTYILKSSFHHYTYNPCLAG